MPEKLRMAQIGTKHGHAQGVMQVMNEHPEVELVGVFEPDEIRRKQVEGSESWNQTNFLDSAEEILEDPSIVAVSSEGSNQESLQQTEQIVKAGKHVFTTNQPATTTSDLNGWLNWRDPREPSYRWDTCFESMMDSKELLTGLDLGS